MQCKQPDIPCYSRTLKNKCSKGKCDQEKKAMTKLMSEEAQKRLIEGAKKGGKALKHFTPESKKRQILGARRGGINSHKNDRQS
jgi:hypothetical protein